MRVIETFDPVPSAIGIARGVRNWDPSTSPAEIRRRAEAAKRERAQQDAAIDAEQQHIIDENRRLSKLPLAPRATLNVFDIYRARNEAHRQTLGDHDGLAQRGRR
jgi:hypothetical protein